MLFINALSITYHPVDTGDTTASVFWFVIAFFHGSVFSEEIKGLEFLNYKFPSVYKLPDLLGVGHISVLHERRFQALPEVDRAFWVISSKIEKL